MVMEFDTTGVADGVYYLQARATDAVNNHSAPSAPIRVVVNNHPLTVVITQPPANTRFKDTAPVTGPGDLTECARILKRLRCERERAAIQREIDRLQGLGLTQHGDEINLLVNQKRTLAQRIEELKN